MNVLAIGAHPDDLEFYAFGTLAKCIRRGDRVTCATVANGNMGHYDLQPDELREIRFHEAMNAAKRIGADYASIDLGDLDVNSYDVRAQKKIVELIRECKPDIIITNSPEDYMTDHVETSRLVFFAAFASSIPHYEAKAPLYEPIVPIYYYESSGGIGFIPDEYVDITDTFELKLEAMKCHESQLDWLNAHDDLDTLRSIEINALYRGMQCKAEYAEGFRICRTHLRLRTKRFLP